MKSCLKTSFLTFLIITTANAYELPEVIGFIVGHVPQERRERFAVDFCCVGDQNGDGCDELMLSRDPYSPYWPGDDFTNQVEIYYGGEEVDDEPDFVFTTDIEGEGIGHKLLYLNNFLDGCFPFIAFTSQIEDYCHIYLFETGESLDMEPEITFRTHVENHRSIGRGRMNSPTDLNGDGFHDLITTKTVNDSTRRLEIYFGGGDFDTIPDWSYTSVGSPIHFEHKSGYDINGDGCDDILLCTPHHKIFLGGEEMDTIPDLQFYIDHFENRTLCPGARLLPDINDDGYDDWGIYFSTHNAAVYGYYIFWGAEEPSLDNYVEIGAVHGFGSSQGQLVGGDFNGDGYGDIVTSSFNGFYTQGAMTLHFGSPWFDGEPDITVNATRDYGDDFYTLGDYIGAVGDYNGDDVDDFVVYIHRSGNLLPALAIFAGNRDWKVGVDEDATPEAYNLSLEVKPNPFNSQVEIDYEVPRAENIRLAVYDTQGRLVRRLDNGQKQRGKYSLNWNARTAGIYFVLLQAGDARVVRKVVCLP